MAGAKSLFSAPEWHHVEGRVFLGNLVLANDGEAHIVVCKSRQEFDAFLVREGIGAQDIAWDRAACCHTEA